ncbi:MAG: MinD/ParA family protein [Kiritimatiellae bacterium]|nr:MinD/ParA family protein [Kiritimatiellia bacterium]
MPEIISVHSFRGGTGKSNTTANLAALMALSGKRVGIVDTDIQSPGIHVIFGKDEESFTHVLNDFLWGRCEIQETAYDVTDRLGPAATGRIFLIPSSVNAGDIARIIQEGYDINLLSEGFRRLITHLNLDYLLIDTHPGLNEETLLSLALSNSLVIVMRPDYQDYQGTGITIEVARELEVPRILLLANKIPPSQNLDELSKRIEAAYGVPPAVAIPHSDEMMLLASHDLFVCRFPNHPTTQQFKRLMNQLTGQ